MRHLKSMVRQGALCHGLRKLEVCVGEVFRTPAGVPAISRGLSAAIPPVADTKIELHPGGVPARVTVESPAEFRREDRPSIREQSPVPLRPLRGRNQDGARVRGRRCAQPPANGCDPSGVDPIARSPTCATELENVSKDSRRSAVRSHPAPRPHPRESSGNAAPDSDGSRRTGHGRVASVSRARWTGTRSGGAFSRAVE